MAQSLIPFSVHYQDVLVEMDDRMLCVEALHKMDLSLKEIKQKNHKAFTFSNICLQVWYLQIQCWDIKIIFQEMAQCSAPLKWRHCRSVRNNHLIVTKAGNYIPHSSSFRVLEKPLKVWTIYTFACCPWMFDPLSAVLVFKL